MGSNHSIRAGIKGHGCFYSMWGSGSMSPIQETFIVCDGLLQVFFVAQQLGYGVKLWQK